MRTCSKCGKSKPSGDFYGVRTDCKSCVLEYKRNRYRLRKLSGRCVDCGEAAIPEEIHCEMCKADANRQTREYRHEKVSKGLCVECGKMAQGWRCDECSARHNRQKQRREAKLRKDVIQRYGGKCHCCEETEYRFLTIDHIDGGGTEHRKKVGQGYKFYLWLRNHSYPEGFQILCWNCNCARYYNGGVCPHQVA